MSDLTTTLSRIIARREGRAIPTRTTSSFGSDPEQAIAIATIKIVTEEHIQAIAFGRIGSVPNVIVRQNPLSRDVSDLLPYAEFMTEWADNIVDQELEGRIWVPHADTIAALDILGHRYWRNQTAPATIVRMGEICRVVAHEARFPGQQLLADAQSLLASHAITGMTPVEEGHLGALLAWFDPRVSDPVAEGRDRIRLPTSGVLRNTPDFPMDDRVDRLRKVAKTSRGKEREAAEHEIAKVLREAVLGEWSLVVEARKRYFDLGLPARGLEKAVKDSATRYRYALENGHFPARMPHKIAIELDEMEVGQAISDHAALYEDIQLREDAANSGKVVQGIVTTLDQPQRGRHPCSITVTARQNIVRLRRDDKIVVCGSNVCGVVRQIDRNEGGETLIRIEILSGVRSSNVLAPSTSLEIMGQPFSFVRRETYSRVYDRQPWHYFGETAPTMQSKAQSTKAPLEIAEEARTT